MRWGALAALLSLGCSGCQARPASEPDCQLVRGGFGPEGKVAVEAQTVVDGLEVPWGIAFLPGGDFLVTERPGRVRLVSGGALLPDPVASLAVSRRDEAGLLGIALHPDFAANRFFYLYATVDDGGRTVNRVERWRLAPDGRAATRDRTILDGIPAAPFHDGGRIRFGPDGMLYVGTGDARSPELSRNPSSLAGKVLRVTPEGEVPSDNPFPGRAAFVIGIRNTQGFDWLDERHLVVTDHGPSGEMGRQGHDEVNVAQAGDDLGWPTIYGCEASSGLVSPRLSWERATPPGGAALYAGDAITEWKGSLLVGTLASQHLHRVSFEPSPPFRVRAHEVYFLNQLGRLREVTMGPDGHLYVSTSNCDGRGSCGPTKDRVIRIVPASR